MIKNKLLVTAIVAATVLSMTSWAGVSAASNKNAGKSHSSSSAVSSAVSKASQPATHKKTTPAKKKVAAKTIYVKQQKYTISSTAPVYIDSVFTIKPTNYTLSSMKITSSNKNVAVIKTDAATGKICIVAVSDGKTEVMAKLAKGGKPVKCKVTVKLAPEAPADASAVANNSGYLYNQPLTAAFNKVAKKSNIKDAKVLADLTNYGQALAISGSTTPSADISGYQFTVGTTAYTFNSLDVKTTEVASGCAKTMYKAVVSKGFFKPAAAVTLTDGSPVFTYTYVFYDSAAKKNYLFRVIINFKASTT